MICFLLVLTRQNVTIFLTTKSHIKIGQAGSRPEFVLFWSGQVGLGQLWVGFGRVKIIGPTSNSALSVKRSALLFFSLLQGITPTCAFARRQHVFFAARCYLASSAALAVMQCLWLCVSVCPSVMFVDCVKTNKHVFKNFSPTGSQAILVFPYQTARQYSDGNPPKGGVECRCGRQKSRFWAYRSLSGFTSCCEPFQRQVQYT